MPTGVFALRYKIAIQHIFDSRIITVIGFGLNPEDHFFSDILDAYLFEASQKGIKRKVIYVKYYRENSNKNSVILDTVRFLRLRFPLSFSQLGRVSNTIEVTKPEGNTPTSRFKINRAELVVIWGDLREKATIEAIKREIEEWV